MVESTTYMDSVANGELVPQVTLNTLANPDEEWTALEIGDILYRQITQWYGDLSSNAVSQINILLLNCIVCTLYNVPIYNFLFSYLYLV